MEMTMLENTEWVACPLCTKLMSFSGGRWFCHSDPETGKCLRMEALEDAMYEFASPRQTFAVVVANRSIVVEFGSTQKGRGIDLFVGKLGNIPKEEVPGLIWKYGWTWYNWVPNKLRAF